MVSFDERAVPTRVDQWPPIFCFVAHIHSFLKWVALVWSTLKPSMDLSQLKRIRSPPKLAVTLLPFQIEGVSWMIQQVCAAQCCGVFHPHGWAYPSGILGATSFAWARP